jgi:hypothetical protein
MVMTEIDADLITIGALGHRSIEHPDVIMRAVDQVIGIIASVFDNSRLAILSSLAEGADRLIAKRCLALPKSKLIAALPLPAEEYVQDFMSPTSILEFQQLLEVADDVIVLSTGNDRLKAYRRAGEYLVESSTVLVAIWDGLPARGTGGTAETVSLARNRKLPLAWIYSPQPGGSPNDRSTDPRSVGEISLERLPDLAGNQSSKE